mgnify:CR=1 FL=1
MTIHGAAHGATYDSIMQRNIAMSQAIIQQYIQQYNVQKNIIFAKYAFINMKFINIKKYITKGALNK